eukprot:g6163.t1
MSSSQTAKLELTPKTEEQKEPSGTKYEDNEENLEHDEDSDSSEEAIVVEGDIMNHKAIHIEPASPTQNRNKEEKRAQEVARHVRFKNCERSDSDDFNLDGDDKEETIPKTWKYTATWIIDGIAMGFLKYIFCIVAAVIIHDDKYTYKTFQDSIGIGISLQCSSTLFTCLITAYKSEVKINIAGPDIIAALFVVEWAKQLSNTEIYAREQALPTFLFLLKKRYHDKAVYFLVFFLFVPFIVFWVVVSVAGIPEDTLRSSSLLFEYYEPHNVLNLYTKFYGDIGNINFSALLDPNIMPQMIVMWIILLIDCLLKIAATRSELEVDFDVRKEIELTGLENMFAAFAGVAAPGYPQVKFNVLSKGIIHNTLDRRVGAFVGVFNGFFWITGLSVPVLNYLPRFVFSLLLFYAAFPFIEKYLYKPVVRGMRLQDILTIYMIVVIVVVMDSLKTTLPSMLVAVGVGVLLSFVTFIHASVQVKVVRNCDSGEYFRSKVVRTYWEEALLTRVGRRVQIIQLDGFIFFLSANAIFDKVKEIAAESDKRDVSEETRFLILDFFYVENVDESGLKTLKDIRRFIQNHDPHKIDLVITGHAKFESQFTQYG